MHRRFQNAVVVEVVVVEEQAEDKVVVPLELEMAAVARGYYLLLSISDD